MNYEILSRGLIKEWIPKIIEVRDYLYDLRTSSMMKFTLSPETLRTLREAEENIRIASENIKKYGPLIEEQDIPEEIVFL